MAIDGRNLQILANYCAAAADAMAFTLMRTAHSTFVKETEDFSCQIVSRSGLAFASPRSFGAPWYSGSRDYNRRGSVTFHDVQARYTLPWSATISIGANNVFARQGPILYSQPSSNFSYYGGFDIGRFIYMKYQQRF